MKANSLLLSALLTVSSNFYIASVIAQEEQENDGVIVEVDLVNEQVITERMWLPGTVLSSTDSELASEVSGRIIWMAQIGDRIAKNEPLIKLNDKRLTIDLAQQRSNIGVSEARVNLLTSRLSRFKTMAELQNTSVDELEGIKSELEVAQQELAQAKHSAELIQYEINQSTIRAPFDTLVVEHLQSPGEFTSTGQIIMRVVDPTRLEATVRAPLSIIPYISEGLDVPVNYNGQKSVQQVRAVVPVGNARSRMMELRIALNSTSTNPFNIGGALSIGLPNSDSHYGHTVPRDALILRQSGTFIYQVNDNDIVQQIAVKTGAGLEGRVEVRSDKLVTGKPVVIRGAERLKNGDKVRVNNESAALVATTKILF